MKLGTLNSAIRTQKEVRIPFTFPGSDELQWVKVQKTDLLGVLKEHYGGERTFETELSIDKDGYVSGFPTATQTSAAPIQVAPQTPSPGADPNQVDLEDLLGDSDGADDSAIEDLLG